MCVIYQLQLVLAYVKCPEWEACILYVLQCYSTIHCTVHFHVSLSTQQWVLCSFPDWWYVYADVSAGEYLKLIIEKTITKIIALALTTASTFALIAVYVPVLVQVQGTLSWYFVHAYDALITWARVTFSKKGAHSVRVLVPWFFQLVPRTSMYVPEFTQVNELRT